jgi:hypothetical protein
MNVSIGYTMVTREQIQRGVRLRLLRPLGNIAANTIGLVQIARYRSQSIREERSDTAWAFSVYWEDYGLKNRFSLYFTEGDLGVFEVASEVPAADIHLTSSRSRRRFTKDAPNQLALPFTEWCLYRGADVVGSFETWS